MYSRDTVVYIRVWKTFPRLLYLDERCGELTRKIVDRLDCLDGVVNNAALTGDFGAVNALDCPRE